MNLVDMTLWIVFPYTVIMVTIMGIIWKDKNRKGSKRVKLLFLFFLLLFIGSGSVIYMGLQNDCQLILYWTKGFLTFKPQIELMYSASTFTQIHILSLFILLLLLPFTGFKLQKRVMINMEDIEDETNLVTRW